MKLILKESVPNLGTVGDVVTVKDGFGRNYLVPRGMAVVADDRNVKVVEHHKRALETRRRRELDKSNEIAAGLAGLELKFLRKSSDLDHLFGSVTNADIEKAIHDKGYTQVTRKMVVVEQPIKNLGEYSVSIRLQGGVKASVKVLVEKEEEAG
jgi:large subunit ribosomal protein L9